MRFWLLARPQAGDQDARSGLSMSGRLRLWRRLGVAKTRFKTAQKNVWRVFPMGFRLSSDLLGGHLRGERVRDFPSILVGLGAIFTLLCHLSPAVPAQPPTPGFQSCPCFLPHPKPLPRNWALNLFR